MEPSSERGNPASGLPGTDGTLRDDHVLRLLEAALRHLPEGVALVDAPTGNVLFRNDEASRIFGRDPRDQNVHGVRDYGAYTGFKADGSPYAAEEWPAARSIQRGEVIVAEEAEIRRLDGSRAFIRMSSAPVRSAEGAILAGLVTFHDVTEQRRLRDDLAFLARASAVLAASLEPAETLVGIARLAVPDVGDWCLVYTVDEGRIVRQAIEHRDPALRAIATRMAERYPPDAKGSSLSRILATGDSELVPEVTEEALRAAAVDAEHLAFLSQLGFRSALSVALRGRSSVLGAVTFISAESGRRYSQADLAMAEELGRRAGMAIENARLFAAEQRARGAAERLQAQTAVLHRLSDTANRSLEPEPVFEAALDAIASVVGSPRASVLTFDDADVMRFRAWRGLSAPYRAAVDGHSPWKRGQSGAQPIVVPDLAADPSLAGYGEVFAREGIRALAFIPLVAGDRVVGKFMLYSDVPRNWQTEELAQASSIAAQVASAVARAEADRALRDAGRRKDEFLAMLSHELRNPLGAVRNALHVMALTPEGDAERRRRCLDIVDRQSASLARIVDDLLDVARVTRGRVELRREPTDVRDVVRRAADAAAPLLARHRVSLEVGPEPLVVDGDPVRLEQVVANLLSNAARYTPPGGEVVVSLLAEGPEAVLRVRDTGPGIPPERLQRVFELFDQGGRDLARTQGGLGIGLTVVRGLVEMHGGVVLAESAGAGQGSTFTVRLPLAGATAPVAAQRPAMDVPAGLRVLVVDDHADAGEMLASLLRAWDIEVDVINDAETVLERLRAFRPDVVLLDIGLPGKDGYTLAAEIRSDPAFARVDLIALTGYGQDADRARALRAGFAAHLVKPVDPASLRAMLARFGGSPDS